MMVNNFSVVLDNADRGRFEAVLLLLAISQLFVASAIAQSPDELAGRAAVQRAIDVRMENPDLAIKATYAIEGSGSRTFMFYRSGSSLRIDEFDDTLCTNRLSVVLFDGENAWAYRFSKHADLLKTARRSVVSQGFVAFDPIQIGMTTFPDLNSNLENLTIDGASAINVKQSMDRNTVTRIEVSRGGIVSEFGVSPVDGRVHYRKNFISGREQSAVTSVFQEHREPVWLPSNVEIEDFFDRGKRSIRNITTIADGLSKSMLYPESLGIPNGVAVIDTGLKRRIGYWNGSEVVSDPVPSVAKVRSGWWLISPILLIVLIFASFYATKRFTWFSR